MIEDARSMTERSGRRDDVIYYGAYIMRLFVRVLE